MPIDRRTALVLVTAIVLVIMVIVVVKRFSVPKAPVYSDNPKDWIESTGNGVKEVNTEEATQEMSYINYIGQQYFSPDIETVFIHDGMYLGNYFVDDYSDDQGNLLIQFTQELNPSNGIPEGFILERLEGKTPFAYIFLDEDWKKNIGDTNLIWGKEYQNLREFRFNVAKPGIYYDKITDDPARFSDNYRIHEGGIIVGKVTLQEIQELKAGGDISDSSILLRLV